MHQGGPGLLTQSLSGGKRAKLKRQTLGWMTDRTEPRPRFRLSAGSTRHDNATRDCSGLQRTDQETEGAVPQRRKPETTWTTPWVRGLADRSNPENESDRAAAGNPNHCAMQRRWQQHAKRDAAKKWCALARTND
eukprot:8340426-Pyramimonas_sp.AAC.2